MVRKTTFLCMLLLLFVGFVSCRDEAPKNELELLSAQGRNIDVSPQATELEVIVNTDYAAWTSSVNAGWVRLSQDGNRLKLKVIANPYPGARTAQVVVLAGGKSESLSINQRGSDTPFVVDQEHAVIDRFALEGNLYVETYIRSWSAESDVDWIEAVAIPHEGRIAVSVKEFQAEGQRTGTITLRGLSEQGQAVVTIVQHGKQRYILPLIAWGESINAILGPEQEQRRHTIKAVPSPATALNPQVYRYYTLSTDNNLFPEIHYETLNLSDKFVYRAVLAVKDPATLRSSEFIAYLGSQGYEPEVVATSNSSTFTHTYINRQNKTRACLQVTSSGQQVFFVPVIDQPSAQPSLASLSLGLTDFHKATPEDVRVYEVARGSELDSFKSSSESKKAGQPVSIYHAEAPFYLHTYIYKERPSAQDSTVMEPRLYQSSHILNNLSQVFYKWGDLYLVTKEFSDLMAKEGFVLVEYDSYTYLYVNRDKQLLLWLKTQYWRDGEKPSYNVIPLYKS
ncbi:MAG: BACON domain-containing carbohydrate-binding protein [Porphyromonas sp.]|nr:BACON domain-containing carbohydrate-binding protein [Porphyromonas sp.]